MRRAAKRKPQSAKRKPPAVERRHRNGSELDAAAALSEQFHGRPASKVRDVAEVHRERTTLTELGALVSLLVWVDEDRPFELTFKGVKLASSPDGGQIYVVGGDQRIPLREMGLDRFLPKDHVTVGAVEKIVYRTAKAMHGDEPAEYEHEFGEEGGELPTLAYDVVSQKLYLTGGSYQVRPEGIVN